MFYAARSRNNFQRPVGELLLLERTKREVRHILDTTHFGVSETVFSTFQTSKFKCKSVEPNVADHKAIIFSINFVNTPKEKIKSSLIISKRVLSEDNLMNSIIFFIRSISNIFLA